MTEYDVVIVGRGPAGLSAALYTVRGLKKTAVLGRDHGAAATAVRVENYFGFAKPMSGEALVINTEHNVARLGGELIAGEMLDVRGTADGGFETVMASGDVLRSRAVLLATGKNRPLPAVKGLAAYEGSGLSRCAVCDGFFFRGKRVAVLGEGPFALAEARELLPLASSVTLLANGREPDYGEPLPDGIAVEPRRVLAAYGEGRLEGVELDGGERLPISGLFAAAGSADAGAVGAKLGLETDGGRIVTDAHGATNVPGVFAAGDCTGAPYQIVLAAAEGARAGMAINEYLRKS